MVVHVSRFIEIHGRERKTVTGTIMSLALLDACIAEVVEIFSEEKNYSEHHHKLRRYTFRRE